MKKKFSVSVNKKIKKFNKKIEIPGDKSCSIRALLFASQCMGESKIYNLLESTDCLDCLKALRVLGVKIIKRKKYYSVYGNGLNSFKIKKKLTRIFIGNSMTTGRLLSGLISTIPSKFYLYGDASANRRDFMRVIEPLEKVGARFSPRKATLPLTMEGTSLPLAQKHIEFRGSSQVKGLICLSALSTPGVTIVEELKKKCSRTHTEIFLKKIGCDIKFKQTKKSNLIHLRGQKNLHSFVYSVGNDPSSACFLICLALLIPGSKLTLPGIICNDTRIGFIKILRKMNGRIKIKNLKRDTSSGELIGTVITYGSKLKPITVSENIAKFVDELPALFVVTALQNGVSKFYRCKELIHKESNRLLEMKKILMQIGIKCKITKNSDMIIYGKDKIETRNKSIVVNTPGDHRINLVSAILALATGIKTKIKHFDSTLTSFPGFISIIKNLGGKIVIS